MKLTKMIKDTKTKFDYIIFLRPDVEYLNKLEESFFKSAPHCRICIPDFDVKYEKSWLWKFTDRIRNYKL